MRNKHKKIDVLQSYTHTYRIGIGIETIHPVATLHYHHQIIISNLSFSFHFLFFHLLLYSVGMIYQRRSKNSERLTHSLTHLFIYVFTCLFPHKRLIILKSTTTTIDDSIVYDCNRISMV